MSAKFTVLLCVHRPPALLPFSMQTVLSQHHANFELFVICDGAPVETVECAKAFAARDDRVRVFDFPKGERHGEAHRHVALAEASGEFVAHIADDDLWFPDHLTEFAMLLERVEFGNLTMMAVRPDGSFTFHPGDLADPTTQKRMLNESWNFFGLSLGGYRLSAYRRLPEGWSPAPAGLPTDLHMWRKFLRLEAVSVGTRWVVESISLPAVHRPQMGLEERRTEIERWFWTVSDPERRSALRGQIAEALAKNHAATLQRLWVRQGELQKAYQDMEKLHGQISELAHQAKEKDATLEQHAREAGQQLQSRDEVIATLRQRIAALESLLPVRLWRALRK